MIKNKKISNFIKFNLIAAMLLSTSGIMISSKAYAAEILNPGTLVSAGRMPTSNDELSDPELCTDGITTDTGALTDLGAGVKYLQIDFGASFNINEVDLWHYYGNGRTYHDVVVMISNSADFNDGKTIVFNNDTDGSLGFGEGSDSEYAESYAGKTIKFPAVNARYIRLYSNGSTSNRYNHYVEIKVWADKTPASYRQNNVTYMNPEYIINKQEDAFIEDKMAKMKALNIKYQMIDVGFFDRIYGTATYEDNAVSSTDNPIDTEINGSFDPRAYVELSHWVSKCRAIDPNMKLIASVNGNGYLHVQGLPFTSRDGVTHTPTLDKDSMHDKIAAKCKEIVETYNLDGINLDFEPQSSNIGTDYRKLIQKVRTAIGPGMELSICSNPFPGYMPNEELALYGSMLDMMVFMDYETEITDAASYEAAIKENIERISGILPQSCKLIALGPGAYRNSESHNLCENAMNHSIAVNIAVSEGARVAGSGLWWFDGVAGYSSETITEELQYFINYWTNYVIASNGQVQELN